MTEALGLSRNAAISMLTRSPHGALEQYLEAGVPAAAHDPEFFSHLVAWNARKGAIHDSKVALPVVALGSAPIRDDAELLDNALAHLALLRPRELERALEFARHVPTSRMHVRRTIARYLGDLESMRSKFERVALQHRRALTQLYGELHLKPGPHAKGILFENEKPGIFGVVASLSKLDAPTAAGVIAQNKIPFLIARGALGGKCKDPAVLQALIGQMSPAELVTNTKWLERLGVMSNPALRAAFDAGVKRTGESASTAAVLKATTAAEAVGGKMGEKLRGAQEKQLDSMAVEGDWLVLGDVSPSMSHAIEPTRQICALLARVAKGKVHLVFFDEAPRYFDVTGKGYDEILELTKRITTGSGTSCGCGVEYARTKNLSVDGIVIVTDGGENVAPSFGDAVKAYAAHFGKDVPAYVWLLHGSSPDTMTATAQRAGIALTTFDLRKQGTAIDSYSIPNMVATMRTNRFSLADEIMATPLLSLDSVLKWSRDKLAA